MYLHLQTKTLMGEVMKEATFSLAEANFAAGDFRYVIIIYLHVLGACSIFAVCRQCTSFNVPLSLFIVIL